MVLQLVHPCKGLSILIQQGFVEQRTENIDDKGLTGVIVLKNGDKEVMISHCPSCGRPIQNVEGLKGKCNVTEVEQPNTWPDDYIEEPTDGGT